MRSLKCVKKYPVLVWAIGWGFISELIFHSRIIDGTPVMHVTVLLILMGAAWTLPALTIDLGNTGSGRGLILGIWGASYVLAVYAGFVVSTKTVNSTPELDGISIIMIVSATGGALANILTLVLKHFVGYAGNTTVGRIMITGFAAAGVFLIAPFVTIFGSYILGFAIASVFTGQLGWWLQLLRVGFAVGVGFMIGGMTMHLQNEEIWSDIEQRHEIS